ncbi:MAG: pitrilysin family protein, partial [Gemmatimonadota bacterium]
MPTWLDALQSTQRHRLNNDLTVLVRRDTTAPVAAVVTYVKAGYFDETDDVSGIAHVLEHMYFKGTPARGVGEIAKSTKAAGGYLNASTIYDHTTYYAVLPRDGFPAGLEIQADAYANSLIDADELARELEVIIEEAKRKLDNPSAVATESMYALLHDQHRIRRWRIGHEAPLRALSRGHLLSFYRNFYTPANTILVIVGDIDVEATLRDVERLYGAVPAGEPVRTPGPNETAPNSFRYRELSGDIAQAHIAFGWRTPGALHDDTPALDVASAILAMGRSSRLYRAVRERRYASSIAAYNYTPTEIGVFGAETEGPPERAWDAARATWTEILAFAESGPTGAELERTRRMNDARWSRRLETMDGQANLLAEWEALGDWRLVGDYYERTMSLDADAIRSAAARYLTADNAAFLVYRPTAAPVFAPDANYARTALAGGERVAPAQETPRTPAIGSRDGSAPEGTEHGVVRFRSGTGVPVLVYPRPGAALVHIGVFTLGGVAAEPNHSIGLSTLLARGALKGTRALSGDQVAEVSESLGGTIVPSVSPEATGWTLSVPVQRFDEAVALLSHVVEHAAFTQTAVDTERAIALAQLEQLRDDMMRYPLRLAVEAAFAGHPYARLTLGDEETLTAITAPDVADWHAQRILHGRSVIAVVGDVDPAATARLTSRAFSAMHFADNTPLLDAPTWPIGVTAQSESRDKAQTGLALAFPGPKRTDPERYATEVLTAVASGLGGRFFEELRDRQSLAYTVQVHALVRRRAGAIIAYIGTSPDKEDAARTGLLGEFAKLRNGDVTDAELQRARSYLIGTHAIARQSGAS